jgi:glycosyltransferase involved in cell wall biosynthesis
MFFNESHWKRTGERCVGLFTLSEYTKKYIEQFVNIPVKSLIHPTYFSPKVFDFSEFANHTKKLILVGNFLRDYSQIFDITTEYHKFILKGTDCIYEKLSEYFSNKSVSYIERLKDAEYDALLSSNVIFLPLHDCAACNTLVECIARNTPVLITKVGAVSEYLGEDYPLYYSNLEEGAEKIKNLDLVEQAHKYLVNLNKDKLTIDYFINDLYNSDIYRSL